MEKVLIFSEYRDTARLLFEDLKERDDQASIALVTGEASSEERAEVFRRFAPLAQGVEGPLRDGQLDLLVATDAIAEGENLQDASMVVNYDVNWTPLRLIQRVGRVDRFTREHRTVRVFNFFPKDDAYERIVGLWQRLEARAEHQLELSGISVVGDQERRPVDLAQVEIKLMEKLARGDLTIDELRSRVTQHLPPASMFECLWSAPEDVLRRARDLPEGVQARIRGRRPGLFVLLRMGNRKVALFHDAESEQLLEAPRRYSFEALLRFITVDPGDDGVNRGPLLDRQVESTVQAWLETQSVGSDEPVRIVAAVEVTRTTT